MFGLGVEGFGERERFCVWGCGGLRRFFPYFTLAKRFVFHFSPPKPRFRAYSGNRYS
jgi:hypothetical protein